MEKTKLATPRYNLLFLLIIFFVILTLSSYCVDRRLTLDIPYSEFQEQLKQGNIEEITVAKQHIYGTFKVPPDKDKPRFVTTRMDSDLAEKLAQYDIRFDGMEDSGFMRSVIMWSIVIIVAVGAWIFIMQKLTQQGVGGRMMSVGKSSAKTYNHDQPGVYFSDVAGVEEAKEELREIIAFLKDQRPFARLGARLPKGVLFVGPPGTGKTLLARAVAGEANVPFFSINGSDFVEMFVGVGAARVRDLFKNALENSPCIIFIDELDALGKKRQLSPISSNDEKEQTLNQLLVELDGFSSRTGVIVIAATNRPEVLDPALLRPGRFDRRVLIGQPDRCDRLGILKVHTQRVKIGVDVDLGKIAAITVGFTGADLANVVNEAALLATREKGLVVNQENFFEAIERSLVGLKKKNRLLSVDEQKIVAFHEMGHALVAGRLKGNNLVTKVSIIPRDIGALGFTLQRPIEDRFLTTKDELEKTISILLAGRASEEIIFAHISTGSADDLAKATEIARQMVTRFGMDENLGHLTYQQPEHSPLAAAAADMNDSFLKVHYGEATALRIDEAMRKMVEEAYKIAKDILSRNLNLLEESARILIEKETLAEKDLQLIFDRII